MICEHNEAALNESITIIQAIWNAKWAMTGAEARRYIDNGKITINDEPVTSYMARVYPGDTVSFLNYRFTFTGK